MNYLARDPMIKIDFQEPDTDQWRAWRTECEEEQQAHNEVIEAHQESEVKSSVYKGEKYDVKYTFYMNRQNRFYGKCAYCESDILTDQPGDMEHFRPKDEVRDIDNNLVVIDENGQRRHPGYYWLAYDWRNLLPSCWDCNRVTTKKTRGHRIGKGTKFPVKGFRATTPGAEGREEPLLINPVLQDPQEHLELEENGLFKGRSPEGRACIDIFGLNVREALIESRKHVYKSVKNDVDMLIIHLFNRSDEVQNRIAEIKKIWEGGKAYSAAGRLAIKERAPVLEQIFNLQDIA